MLPVWLGVPAGPETCLVTTYLSGGCGTVGWTRLMSRDLLCSSGSGTGRSLPVLLSPFTPFSPYPAQQFVLAAPWQLNSANSAAACMHLYKIFSVPWLPWELKLLCLDIRQKIKSRELKLLIWNGSIIFLFFIIYKYAGQKKKENKPSQTPQPQTKEKHQAKLIR